MRIVRLSDRFGRARLLLILRTDTRRDLIRPVTRYLSQDSSMAPEAMEWGTQVLRLYAKVPTIVN